MSKLSDILNKFNKKSFIHNDNIFLFDPLIEDLRDNDYVSNDFLLLENKNISEFPSILNMNYIENNFEEQEDIDSGNETSEDIEYIDDEEKKISSSIKSDEKDEMNKLVKKLKNNFPKNKLFIEEINNNDKKEIFQQNTNFKFIEYIKEYRKNLLGDKKKIKFDCNISERKFRLMNHQKLVQKYVNINTPYRGILVYHGLGAGKTCTSIAVAEGMKNINSKIKKKICVLSPASLEKNFIEEIKKCGDPIYDIKKYKKKIIVNKTNKILLKAISKILGIQNYRPFKIKGEQRYEIWLPTKKLNDIEINNEEKKYIDKQINIMIRSRYDFIHYNGITERNYNKKKEKNIFDHKVVIVDEVHNFVNKISNKMREYSFNPTKLNNQIPYILYKKLMSAKNCKLIFLSGTPIINRPVELGILFNMLRGEIIQYDINLRIKKNKSLNLNDIKKELKNISRSIDYLNFESGVLKFTRLPYNFINIYNSNGSKIVGIKKIPGYYEKNEKIFIKKIINELKKKFPNIIQNITHHQTKNKNIFTTLTDSEDSFNKIFFNENYELINKTYFQKRIVGLTSYYKSPQENLMPKINNFNNENYPEIKNMKIHEINMSKYQFNKYLKKRNEERKENKGKKKKKNLYDKTTSTFKVYSRMLCNFVFPEKILTTLNPKTKERPRPNDKKIQDIIDLNNDLMDNYNTTMNNEYKITIDAKEKEHIRILKKMIIALTNNNHSLIGGSSINVSNEETSAGTSGDSDNQTSDGTSEDSDKETSAGTSGDSDNQTSDGTSEDSDKETSADTSGDTNEESLAGTSEDKDEESLAGTSEDKDEESLAGTSEDKDEETSADNSEDTNEESSVDTSEDSDNQTSDGTSEEKDEESSASKDIDEEGTLDTSKDSNESSSVGTSEDTNEESSSDSDEDTSISDGDSGESSESINEPKFNGINYLSDDNLKIYSPKFLEMIKEIRKSIGCNLIYSSFMTGEGLGIFSKVLESPGNNYSKFIIEKKQDEYTRKYNWELSKETKKKLEKIINKEISLNENPFYMVFSGKEEVEAKEIFRLIYNGDWDNLPSNANNIKQYLIDNFNEYTKSSINDVTNPKYSKFIKIFMITASGAEGISLKNTKYVHIMEPFWNPIRIEQVIGRARRICSHQGLPSDQRFVDVHLYLMTIPKELIKKEKDEKNNFIIQGDNEKTTDEALWEKSLKKNRINKELLNLIKETAIDCEDMCKEFQKKKNTYILDNPKFTTNPKIDELDKKNFKEEKYKKIFIGTKKDKKKYYCKIKFDEYQKNKKTKNFLHNKEFFSKKDEKLGVIKINKKGGIKRVFYKK